MQTMLAHHVRIGEELPGTSAAHLPADGDPSFPRDRKLFGGCSAYPHQMPASVHSGDTAKRSLVGENGPSKARGSVKGVEVVQ